MRTKWMNILNVQNGVGLKEKDKERKLKLEIIIAIVVVSLFFSLNSETV